MRPELRTALAGMVLLAIGLGISRFLLTPLLPLMQADAGVSLAAGGWLASSNLIGYLAGALLCTAVPIPARVAIGAGLVAAVLSTLCMGLFSSLPAWLLARAVGGIAAAGLTVHGIAWCMTRLHAAGRESLEVVLFSGTGIGIVASGVVVALLEPLGVSSHAFWIGFGLLCVPAAWFAWRATQAGAAALPAATVTAGEPARPRAPTGPAWTLAAMYGLVGFGYIVPATFLPLIAVEQLHLPALREWFWPLFGGAMVAATLAMRWLPARIDNRIALAASCAAMLAGIVLCVAWPTITGLCIGTVLLGGVTMPNVMLVMREARLLAPRDPTRLIAVLSIAIGIGQIIGPAAAAWLAERSHGFTLPMLVAAGVSALAFGFILLQRHGHGAATARGRRAMANAAGGRASAECG
jgi:MFS family permease